MILISFFCSNCSSNRNHNTHDYEKIADKITIKSIKNLTYTYDLKLIGHGGSMMNNVKLISLHFYYYQSTSIEKARNILLDITTKLISDFNSDEKIRPFLANYPFNETNLDIAITFLNKDNDYQSHPSISTVSTRNSKVYYYNYSPEKDRLVSILEEPYAEALQKAVLTECELNSSKAI